MLLILFFSIFINVQEIVLRKTGWAWFSYVDELAAVLPYILLPLILKRRNLPGWILVVLALPVLSVVHAFAVNAFAFGEARAFQAITQSLINFKFFLYFCLFYFIAIISSSRLLFTHIFGVCIAISLCGYFLNFLYPGYFIFSDAPWHAERGRIAGFQFKPNDLALLLSFGVLYIALTSYRGCKSLFLILVILLLVYLTSSRTALIISFLGFIIYLILSRLYFVLLGGGIVCLLSLALFFEDIQNSFFVTETISNFGEFSSIEDSQYIRAIMVYLAFVIMLDFPFGAGAGNFGSVMSSGSPVYAFLGVEGVSFFSELNGIFDSGFASLLGEYGVIGVCCYFLILYKTLKYSIPGSSMKVLLLMLVLAVLLLVQPVFSYQVNSVNFLLLLFSLREFEQRFGLKGV